MSAATKPAKRQRVADRPPGPYNFASHHFVEGINPSGGNTFGTGFAIGWQRGLRGNIGDRLPQDGAIVEDVISAAKERLEYFQRTRFHCQETAEAIFHLERALDALAERTERRTEEGTEGTFDLKGRVS
jgi:hypothetical protein